MTQSPEWLVPLLDDDGDLCGTGIVVSPERILTCNHVATRVRRVASASSVQLEVEATEPDPRVDLALLTCTPALQVRPARFVAGFDAKSCRRLLERDPKVGYWYQDAQVLDAMVSAARFSVHVGGGGLRHLSLAEGLPDGASGGAAMVELGDEPVCFGVVRRGGDHKPCSTLTGADAVVSFARSQARSRPRTERQPALELETVPAASLPDGSVRAGSARPRRPRLGGAVLASLGVLLGVLATVGGWRWSTADSSAAVEFQAYSRGPSAHPEPVREGSTLRSGDRVWFEVKALEDVYLHVVQVSPEGAATPLYPPDGELVLARGQSSRIPRDPRSYFVLDSEVGTERVLLISTRAPLSETDVGLARLIQIIKQERKWPEDVPLGTALYASANTHPMPQTPSLTRGLRLETEGPGIRLQPDHLGVAVALFQFRHAP